MTNLLIFPGCEAGFIPDDNKHEFEKNILIEPFGSENSFDIATWNIEHFPKNQDFTVPYLFQIIHDIDIDLIAVQEIDDKNLFMRLIDSLDGYQGGYLQILKIDEMFSNYVDYVSDHRPVLARFFIF